MKIRPLHDRVLRQAPQRRRTDQAGGMYHPRLCKGKAHAGEGSRGWQRQVLEDGKVAAPMDIKAGDTILFGKYAGTEIKIEGEEHLILREEDVIGVIEK
jgi:chaperonin GroES